MTESIAIIGAGICGLSTAFTLVEQGFHVEIIAESFPPETTSNKAAAFWFPYHIQSDQRCISWCRASYEKYTMLMANADTGISMHRLLKVAKAGSDESGTLWRDFMPEGAYQAVEKEELKKGFETGFTVQVPLVQTQIFLPWLMDYLKQKGVNFIKHKVECLEELYDQYKWVVNCSGLGSRELCQDESIYPIRGQVAVIAPHKGLPIFLYEEQPFYIVPREDATIIGGTFEENVWVTSPEEETIQALYKQAVNLYPELQILPVTESWAGLRPYRPEIRVEQEAGKKIIHNYGHGGSGFTLAWGCAAEVLRMINS